VLFRSDFHTKKDTILEFAQTIIRLYENMDDSLQFKFEKNTEVVGELAEKAKVSRIHRDFRGVACPMNFVKTKIELSKLNTGDILEILLDDGEPIQNVPGSVRNEGHTILEEKQIDQYWQVVIEKTV
jgi:sulfite reductase (ferredoxin)